MLDVATANKVRRVYHDHGTGTRSDLSVFQADLTHIPGDYYIIGQVVVTGSYPKQVPPSSVVLIRPLAKGLIKPPTGYTLVWNDKGSGGDQDGSVWRVEAPAGYIAMGDVFTNHYSQPPESFTKRYACIREDLVVNGQLPKDAFWTDRDSGASMSSSIWQVENAGVQGLAGFFIAEQGYGKPSRDVYVLPAQVTAK